MFAVDLVFDGPYPRTGGSRPSVRLHCTPAVNLFEHDAEPARAEHTWAEQRVIPSLRHRRSIEAYDVLSVTSVEEDGPKRTYMVFKLSSDAERAYDVLCRVATPAADLYPLLASPDLDAGAHRRDAVGHAAARTARFPTSSSSRAASTGSRRARPSWRASPTSTGRRSSAARRSTGTRTCSGPSSPTGRLATARSRRPRR